MNIYKLIFANNEVVDVKPIQENIALNSPYHYEHKDGRLIYALIKADTPDTAIENAHMLLQEVRRGIFGNDYIV
jgi:hypothetical protein